jgi:two-component system, NarL family, nitrate/nitrite response regulator NarL
LGPSVRDGFTGPRARRVEAAPRREGGVVEANVAAQVAVSGGERPLRVCLVWGVRFTRESIAELLEREPMVTVVAQCASLSEAVASSPALQADIVLLDARLPEGPAAVRRALDIAPDLRIIACSVRESEEEIIAWAEVGVIGYIPRTTALADFVRLIVDIHNGEQTSSGRVVTGLLRRLAVTARRRPDRSGDFPSAVLTRRERQAAELIRSGLSDKEIARQLNISLATTKSHVHNLLGKLHVHRRSQVAEWLREYEHPPVLTAARAPLN